jgi:hypothetical protein
MRSGDRGKPCADSSPGAWGAMVTRLDLTPHRLGSGQSSKLKPGSEPGDDHKPCPVGSLRGERTRLAERSNITSSAATMPWPLCAERTHFRVGGRVLRPGGGAATSAGGQGGDGPRRHRGGAWASLPTVTAKSWKSMAPISAWAATGCAKPRSSRASKPPTPRRPLEMLLTLYWRVSRWLPSDRAAMRPLPASGSGGLLAPVQPALPGHWRPPSPPAP